MRLAVVTAIAVCIAACAVDQAEEDDGGSFIADGKADGTGLAEGSPLARAILAQVNQLSEDQLVAEAGLLRRSAHNIALARRKSDGLIATLGELDAVSWVGSKTFEHLRLHAEEDGWIEGVDGLAGTRQARLTALTGRIAADGRLTFAEADELAAATLEQGLTLAALRQAQAFLADPGEPEAGARDTDAAWGARAVLETLYFGMPRTLTGLDGSGLAVVETTTHRSTQIFLGDRQPEPNRLTLAGAVTRDTRLVFWIWETRVAVDLPAGTSAEAAAARIAAAINASQELIAPAYELPIGQIEFPSDTYLGEISARADGATVIIDAQLDS